MEMSNKIKVQIQITIKYAEYSYKKVDRDESTGEGLIYGSTFFGWHQKVNFNPSCS